MESDRSRYGLLVSASGAVLLIVSVFLPFYEVSAAGGVGVSFASRLWGGSGALSHGAVSAEQAFTPLSIVLLVLAALAILDALAPLARAGSPVPEGAGRAVVPLGVLAAAAVAYRMISPPSAAGGALDLSLALGAWLGLLGALTMVTGGMWPRTLPAISPPDGSSVFSGLAGPGAG